MPKIYIPAPFGYSDRCVLGDSEGTHRENFSRILGECFKENGIDFLYGREMSYETMADECNAYEPDIYYSPHTAVSKKHDSRFSNILIYNTQPSALSFRIAERIRRRREEIYPRSVFINAVPDNTEIVKVKAPAVVDYIAFHDQNDEAEFFHNNIDGLAFGVAAAICDYYGIAFIPPKITAAKSEFCRTDRYERLIAEMKRVLDKYS